MRNFLVKKPWGEEYIICKTKKAATWHLKINSRKKTSLHCHPNKKTGFILLDGKVEVMIGFYEKRILKAPDKLMIRPGLFHSTKGLAKKDSIVLEIETPINKDDLVRYKDNYGRENKPYEGKKFTQKTSSDLIKFKKPKKNLKQIFKIGSSKILIETHKNFKTILKNKKDTIFAVIQGAIVDKNKRKVISIGDIIKTNDLKTLSQVFKIDKSLSVVKVNKL